MINAKKHIKNLNRTKDNYYFSRHGKVRMDNNERTIPFEQDFIRLVQGLINSEMLSSYPEPYPLYEKIAQFYGVEIDEIFLTHGSDIAIKSVFEAYIEPNDKILMHDPSYAMYSVYAQMFQAEVTKIGFNPDFTFPKDYFLECIDESTKMVIFENPNGFVGTEIDIEFLLQVLRKCEQCNTIFLVDEAYFHFIDTTLSGYVKEYKNLIISRTFSKAVGLASCRIGFLISDASNIENIYKVKPINELTQFGVEIGKLILDNFEEVLKNIKQTAEVVSVFKKRFDLLGLAYTNSVANFITVRIPVKSQEEFDKRLKENNFLIRRPFEQEILRDYRRIGMCEMRHVDDFFKIIEEELDYEKV